MKSLTSVKKIIQNWQELKSVVAHASVNSDSSEINITGSQGSFFSFFIYELCRSLHMNNLHAMQYNNSSRKIENSSFVSEDVVIVVPTENAANELYTDLSVICCDEEEESPVEIFVFPEWGVVPYRPAARGSAVFGKRAGVLSSMLIPPSYQASFKSCGRIFIITQRSFMQPLPAPDYLKSYSFRLSKGDSIDTTEITKKLTEIGFIRVPKVSVRGEFSLRGEVIDIFLPKDEMATRIIFDFDEIESIRKFDVNTQTTTGGTLNSVFISPMKEVLWNDSLIEKLDNLLTEYQESAIDENTVSENVQSVHLKFSDVALNFKEKLISDLMDFKEAEGEEFYYGFLWDRMYSFADYINPSSKVIFYDYDRTENALPYIKREIAETYRRARGDYPVFPPEKIMYDFYDIKQKFLNCILFKTILTEKSTSSEKIEYLSLDVNPSRSFFGNLNYMKDELRNLQADGWKFFVFADNENQSLRLRELFREFIDVQDSPAIPLELIPKPISSGFNIPDLKLMVIQENEIFGRRKYTPKATSKAKSQAIDTFVELTPGDYIVHVNWGIGKFHGIERVKTANDERDYIKLEYADGDTVFVPIEQVNLVQRYIGSEGESPRLDTLGGKSWENRKNKVKKAVEDLAEKLIDLYSRRQASVGYAFPKESEWQTAFEAAFPYEDTPDQINVTEEVKADMERPVPMDRLVCGDVGYGKTEIAMRAAFKAVMGGKQVAFLAPTTILAEQHYDNCKERFKNFPVKIERMSRFVPAAEQKKILERLKNGDVDILIGTHRIIQKDVSFKNLGLMIIDEEQRFGVKDKERLKQMKNNIDCLTMSATPIPRTLHMSLLKIRDMSLLTTPPQNRQPIETVIDEYKDERIIQAIRREIERGGQVFYLHNRVENLLEVRQKIEKLVPEVLVDTAHGKMTSNQLDDIFHRFKMGGFQVLIATTIIENGIDIPNVNTIIIDRADMYGVSQLYQLRGRVGRSDRQAYAYLLYPENKALSEVAMKRLQVISDFTELGSGFKIAMKDMEIRGAGNLLGRDQSGDVYSVGFDLYVRLLNEAVTKLTQQKDYREQKEVIMELEYTGFIPDSYIINPQIKMEVYKKIAGVMTESELEGVVAELNDRFGPIPDEVSSLLALSEIKIIARKLHVSNIKEKQGEVRIEFDDVSDISIDKLLSLIKENPGIVRLNSQMQNVIFIKVGKIGLKEKSEFIREKLAKLG